MHYFLFLKYLFNGIEVHIAFDLQFLVKRGDPLINLFSLFYFCCFLTFIMSIIPRFQYTETMHGNFRASVTVFMSAMKPNLKIFVELICNSEHLNL